MVLPIMRSLAAGWSLVRSTVVKHKTAFIVAGIGLVLGGLVAAYFLREDEWSQQYEDMQATRDAEVKSIIAAQEAERAALERNVADLKQRLEASQAAYNVALASLTATKKKTIKTVVDKYGDDPAELARQLAALTGLKTVTEVPK